MQGSLLFTVTPHDSSALQHCVQKLLASKKCNNCSVEIRENTISQGSVHVYTDDRSPVQTYDALKGLLVFKDIRQEGSSIFASFYSKDLIQAANECVLQPLPTEANPLHRILKTSVLTLLTSVVNTGLYWYTYQEIWPQLACLVVYS